jgi:hypothetical protein
MIVSPEGAELLLFNRPPPRPGAKAWLVGGGIASMSAAVFLIRDGDLLGSDITIIEQSDAIGGSLDGSGSPEAGYVVRGGRMIESKYLCTFDLFSSIPTLAGDRTVTQEILDWNATMPTSSKSRLFIDAHEALDRISRDQADIATLYKHLKFAGVPILTLAEGEISELHVGLKGTMNALFLKDLAAKTHRGIRGRVEEGKSGGGLCYGYKIVKQFDARGEPIRGDREIVDAEAYIVRRIFREFADGVSPRTIAHNLNSEGIPGPNGKPWNDTTIRGNVKRGTGIVNNDLYVGRLIWNRLRYIKDPSTGRRISRLNPDTAWIVRDVSELRIVDDELWKASRERQREISKQHANLTESVRKHHQANALGATRRPKSLLSGLIFCGSCEGPFSLQGGSRFACSNHCSKGTCDNSRTIPRDDLERRVLTGLQYRMMAPEIAAEAMRAYAEESNRLNRQHRSNSDAWKAELANVDKQIAQIVDAIAEGMFRASMRDRQLSRLVRPNSASACGALRKTNPICYRSQL